MEYQAKASETILESQAATRGGASGISRPETPATGRNAAKRNFILQQGFENPAPAVVPLQYSALVFQPRIVLAVVVAGILFQSQTAFAALGTLLVWSSLFPKLNPLSALYNWTLGRRPGAFRLGPAPAPRRAAERMAGVFALTCALLIYAGFAQAAYAAQTIFLAAALAVEILGLCPGTFVYHLLRGNGKFARQTLPWARNEMTGEVRGNGPIVESRTASRSAIGGNANGDSTKPGRAARWVVFAYGLFAYACAMGVFVYSVGFIGNFAVPKAMDSGRETSLAWALLVDSLLLGVFAVQHSVMARSWFKRWLTRVVPAAAERSTYVLLSSLALILLFWQWQPIGGTVWDITHPVGRPLTLGLYAAGWIVVLVTTFLINHFDLFGLRQVYLHLRGKDLTPLRFVTPGPYKHVRHPLYIGWLTVFWATPTMTAAHLVFAALTTAYILVAIRFEERDLVKIHGRKYAEYRKRVPMLIPRLSANDQPSNPATISAGPSAA